MLMLILSDSICLDDCKYDDNVNLARQCFHGVYMVMLMLILSDNICMSSRALFLVFTAHKRGVSDKREIVNGL